MLSHLLSVHTIYILPQLQSVSTGFWYKTGHLLLLPLMGWNIEVPEDSPRQDTWNYLRPKLWMDQTLDEREGVTIISFSFPSSAFLVWKRPKKLMPSSTILSKTFDVLTLEKMPLSYKDSGRQTRKYTSLRSRSVPSFAWKKIFFEGGRIFGFWLVKITNTF